MYLAKKAVVLGLAFLASIGFVQAGIAAKKLMVVTTTENLKSLAETVGGSHVEVITLSRGYQDPHYIQAKPSFMIKARRADLWIRIGMDIEIGYERLILEGSRNRKILVGREGHLDASLNVLRLEVPGIRVDRSMGDVHPLGNPHYWLDPWNARIMARDIANRLSSIDPKNSNDYQKNLGAFIKRLDKAMFGDQVVEAAGSEALWKASLDGSIDEFLKEKSLEPSGWLAKAMPIRNAKIVTYHKSWVYFAHRFGLVVIDEIEPKPGIPPGPRHLVEVLNNIKSHRVSLIVVEPYYSRKPADTVASKTGADVLVLSNSVGGSPECTDYIAMISNAIDKLAEGLK